MAVSSKEYNIRIYYRMVNNGFRNIAPDMSRLVGTCDELVCVTCKKVYVPDKQEISTKNPSVYYKSCYTCRTKKANYMKRYWEKKSELKEEVCH